MSWTSRRKEGGKDISLKSRKGNTEREERRGVGGLCHSGFAPDAKFAAEWGLGVQPGDVFWQTWLIGSAETRSQATNQARARSGWNGKERNGTEREGDEVFAKNITSSKIAKQRRKIE